MVRNSPKASGLYHEASDLQCSSHKQMSTKCSSLLANSEACPSYPASPPHTNPCWEHQRLAVLGWPGKRVPDAKKRCSSKQDTCDLQFSSTKHLSFPSLQQQNNWYDLITQLGLLLLCLAFEILWFKQKQVDSSLLNLPQQTCTWCVVWLVNQAFNPTPEDLEATPVPLSNVTDVQALEDNSDTLQLKMLMEAPETLHITGVLQTALSCALPTLQLLSNCWVILQFYGIIRKCQPVCCKVKSRNVRYSSSCNPCLEVLQGISCPPSYCFIHLQTCGP